MKQKLKYIKELIVDKIAYIDIPKVFEIEEQELLVRLLSIISTKPGMIFDYDSIANDLKRNRRTISNYIFYLEKVFLIKKVYSSTVALAFLYGAELGNTIETLVLQNHDSKFF